MSDRLDDRERLKELSLLLDALAARPQDQVILVEGPRDRGALKVLGVEGPLIQVQSRNGLLGIAEELAKEGKSAIILTDWDRKGGQLARLLRQDLRANGVRFDDELRLRLVLLVKAEIKDIESLPAFFTRLVSLAQSSEAERRSKIIRDRKARKEYRPKP